MDSSSDYECSIVFVFKGVFLAHFTRELVRSPLLLHDWPEWNRLDLLLRDCDLGLHQVLGELVPHCLVPLALDRGAILR